MPTKTQIPVIDYTLIDGQTLEGLVANVLPLLAQGYELLGGPMAFNYRPGRPDIPQPSQFFAQALVKHAEEPPPPEEK